MRIATNIMIVPQLLPDYIGGLQKRLRKKVKKTQVKTGDGAFNREKHAPVALTHFTPDGDGGVVEDGGQRGVLAHKFVAHFATKVGTVRCALLTVLLNVAGGIAPVRQRHELHPG